MQIKTVKTQMAIIYSWGWTGILQFKLFTGVSLSFSLVHVITGVISKAPNLFFFWNPVLLCFLQKLSLLPKEQFWNIYFAKYLVKPYQGNFQLLWIELIILV